MSRRAVYAFLATNKKSAHLSDITTEVWKVKSNLLKQRIRVPQCHLLWLDEIAAMSI